MGRCVSLPVFARLAHLGRHIKVGKDERRRRWWLYGRSLDDASSAITTGVGAIVGAIVGATNLVGADGLNLCGLLCASAILHDHLATLSGHRPAVSRGWGAGLGGHRTCSGWRFFFAIDGVHASSEPLLSQLRFEIALHMQATMEL